MRTSLQFAVCVAAALSALSGLQAAETGAPEDNQAAIDFFEKKIRPLFVDNCYNCHSATTNSQGGLRIDDRNGLLTGGGRGPAVIPGNPDESLLVRAVGYTADLKMPPKKQLSPEQVADLAKWIRDGAVWPGERTTLPDEELTAEYEELRKQHWAWQPIRVVEPPSTSNDQWVRDPIDAFVLARLDQSKLAPVGDADKRTLIRRVTFDLTGLPPTPEQIAKFENDDSPAAFTTLVDQLLSSPAFGERWGRHWLDVARYGESTGSSRNLPYPHAWRYRDYVIDSFNKDKPYNQFLREQIAGDLLPADSPEQHDEQLIATGFLALGVKDVNQRYKVRFTMDNIDEQIDTVSRSVLALTASCARCHDHKFDPIPSTDYYALAGIFHSTDLCAGVRNKMGGGGLDYYDTQSLLHIGPEVAPDPAAIAKIEEVTKAVAQARADFEALKGNPEGNKPGPNGKPKRANARQKMRQLQLELAAISDPTANGRQAAVGAREAKNVGDTELRIRGEAERLGPTVPRGFLTVVQFAGQPQIDPNHSGRLELAAWLTNEQNPLTPRVFVNRVWRHMFGAGLVSSVDNFGVTGDKPSHPELLDHLTSRFVREGWSIKKLIRTIALSHAYQLSCEKSEAATVDPAARLIWRHNPRRLEAEEIRDAMLAASGTLDYGRPAGSPAQELKVVELRNNGPEARKIDNAAGASVSRSVYLPLVRDLTPISLEVFDFAEQGMVTGSRDTTTVAPQALFLLNDPLVRRQSLALAEQLLNRSGYGDATRIDYAYRLTLGRPATLSEIDLALAFLADYEAATIASSVIASTKAEAASTSVVAEDAPEPPDNPDEADQSDTPIAEVVVAADSPRAAAWASFCQALFASAEFRYLK